MEKTMDREFNEDIHRSVEGVESMLSIRDFNLWYGDFQALKSITLEIPWAWCSSTPTRSP